MNRKKIINVELHIYLIDAFRLMFGQWELLVLNLVSGVSSADPQLQVSLHSSTG